MDAHSKIQLKVASSESELKAILELQAKNLKGNLSSSEMDQEGFVTVHHDLETLKLLNSQESQIIAVQDEKVVGYALVMVPQLRNSIPILVSLFEKIESISYKNKKIEPSQYYVMGQVCIAKAYRGQGLFARLYQKHKEQFKQKYDYCITEVSSKNKRSIRAHEKVGFKNLHSFSDETDDWNIIILDLGD